MSSISLKNISKSFKLNNNNPFNKNNNIQKKVLDCINFNISNSEIVGITGPNGSGKTTLLKVISGILIPDKGIVDIQGEISPMLDIGIGFHPELTGRENIILYSSMTGNNTLIETDIEKIRVFSGLSEESFDQKYKTYSSGMRVRVGFSTISFLKPDIVILDEINSVGDINFQKKTYDKIVELANNSKILIIVSHDVDFLKKICTRLIILTNGKVLCDSKPETAAYEYLEYMKENISNEI
ncbi:MAG: ABC transporter ATP-binding protein [Candidatus Muirbacterium halophilum]|nr:ABC transporter ATP-binding protein [Candidatus Muirbacterium halophilum]